MIIKVAYVLFVSLAVSLKSLSADITFLNIIAHHCFHQTFKFIMIQSIQYILTLTNTNSLLDAIVIIIIRQHNNLSKVVAKDLLIVVLIGTLSDLSG